MAIFKHTKAYEVENVQVCEKEKTTGVNPEYFIAEKTGKEPRTMKVPSGVTKVYINN
jgi:hypothetical protein